MVTMQPASPMRLMPQPYHKEGPSHPMTRPPRPQSDPRPIQGVPVDSVDKQTTQPSDRCPSNQSREQRIAEIGLRQTVNQELHADDHPELWPR